jgi:hypothetical protein
MNHESLAARQSGITWRLLAGLAPFVDGAPVFYGCGASPLGEVNITFPFSWGGFLQCGERKRSRQTNRAPRRAQFSENSSIILNVLQLLRTHERNTSHDLHFLSTNDVKKRLNMNTCSAASRSGPSLTGTSPARPIRPC